MGKNPTLGRWLIGMREVLWPGLGQILRSPRSRCHGVGLRAGELVCRQVMYTGQKLVTGATVGWRPMAGQWR